MPAGAAESRSNVGVAVGASARATMASGAEADTESVGEERSMEILEIKGGIKTKAPRNTERSLQPPHTHSLRFCHIWVIDDEANYGQKYFGQLNAFTRFPDTVRVRRDALARDNYPTRCACWPETFQTKHRPKRDA